MSFVDVCPLGKVRAAVKVPGVASRDSPRCDRAHATATIVTMEEIATTVRAASSDIT